MPGCVKGMTVKDKDDNFNVYVNENLSDEATREVIAHEMRHINKNHFYNGQTAMHNELEAE